MYPLPTLSKDLCLTDVILDISYFEDDDEKLKKIEQDYRKGDLLTGELKKMAIALLQEYVQEFQERRKAVTDEVLNQYMTPRKLEWGGNPNSTASSHSSAKPTEAVRDS